MNWRMSTFIIPVFILIFQSLHIFQQIHFVEEMKHLYLGGGGCLKNWKFFNIGFVLSIQITMKCRC